MKAFKEFTILLILMGLMIAGTLCGCSVNLPEETTEKTYASGTFHENRPYAEIGSEEYIFKSDGMEETVLKHVIPLYKDTEWEEVLQKRYKEVQEENKAQNKK